MRQVASSAPSGAARLAHSNRLAFGGGCQPTGPKYFAVDQTLETAARRAETEGRWLLVDVTDKSKPIAWATLYTTWRDPESSSSGSRPRLSRSR